MPKRNWRDPRPSDAISSDETVTVRNARPTSAPRSKSLRWKIALLALLISLVGLMWVALEMSQNENRRLTQEIVRYENEVTTEFSSKIDEIESVRRNLELTSRELSSAKLELEELRMSSAASKQESLRLQEQLSEESAKLRQLIKSNSKLRKIFDVEKRQLRNKAMKEHQKLSKLVKQLQGRISSIESRRPNMFDQSTETENRREPKEDR